jgi:hypothetical protein
MDLSNTPELSDRQLEAAKQELIVKFPRVERLPKDPELSRQNWALFSFKFLPKPVNGVYGFLKPRGVFEHEDGRSGWEAHAENIIRSVDSKHRIWPYRVGEWMPITVNEDFAVETLEVGQQDELKKIYNQQESNEQKDAKQNVREIKDREKKLREDTGNRETDRTTLDYYAQKIMMLEQLETWLDEMRKRKRQMIKALKDGETEIKELEEANPQYRDQVADKIREIREEIGLE